MQTKDSPLSEKEKLHQLKGRKKIQYLWDYYKLHFVVAGIILYILGYTLYGHFTKKNNVLYAAFINVAPSETLTETLSDGFLASQDLDLNKNAFYLYSGLYLTSDEADPYHEYTYASRIKLIAAIDSETIDIALMDQEAFDAFSQNGYLYDMEEFLSETDPRLYQDCRELLQNNIVILEDNSEEAALDSSVEYIAETEEYPMALDVSRTPLLEEAGFTDPVYLGIIKNTPRKEAVAEYIRYLCFDPLSDEVRGPKDIRYGMPFGYTLSDEVRSPEDIRYGMPFGYTGQSMEKAQPSKEALSGTYSFQKQTGSHMLR